MLPTAGDSYEASVAYEQREMFGCPQTQEWLSYSFQIFAYEIT